MRAYQHKYSYKQHEYATTSSKDWRQRFVEIVKGVGIRCYNFLNSANEPEVNEVKDKNGLTSWQVYDPQSDRTFYLSSHQAVLEWIEERYYNRQAPSFFD